MSFMLSSPSQSAPDDQTLQALDALSNRVSQIEMLFDKSTPLRVPSDEKLAIVASGLARMRQRRGRYFSAQLFAEPAWDILLDLFINQARGFRVATTSLCLAANAPQATGLRHIARLEEEGLLRRFDAPEDRRLVLVEITSKGYGQMRKCLSELVMRFDFPCPQ